MNETVFALDIGTQSVSGILLEKRENTYQVIDYYIKHHQERSMLDGQIQNVVQVAEVITAVKNKLEVKHGPLKKVCVAAAGRALKTIQTKKTISITNKPIATNEEINHLELSAVQQAQLQLVKENNHQFSHYHCVGFSVLHYYLDGDRIGSLIDQIGNEATVEIIATFLPKVVIESLLAALERSGLIMEALTLEPIAAIHVLIPTSMRRLNVALIDIGAGTSDIAISNDGTVIAYGMVPVAGDEITEAISDQYLLDFKEAEMTKQQIVNENKAVVQDILGFETEVTFEDLVEKTSERVDHLAALLGEEVLRLNAKVPQAVMLVGGGSLTPGLAGKLASYLQLPKNRVALRGIDGIPHLEKENQVELPEGPEFVTPIGIAISATQNPLHYTTVYVNDRTTLMFQTKQLTIGDSLIQAGIDINKFYGKIGLSYFITVNGQSMTLRGAYGEVPKIHLNGEEATVTTPIQAEDRIIIEKGRDGKQPHISIQDILGKEKVIPFQFNGTKHTLKPVYYVNNQVADPTYIVQDKDNISHQFSKTIQDFLLAEYPEWLKEDNKLFAVTVNQRKVKINKGTRSLLLNGKAVSLSTPIQENDEITVEYPEKVTLQTLINQLEKTLYYSIQVTFNGTPVILTQHQLIITRNGDKLSETSELADGDTITIKDKPIKPFIFQDVFRYVDIDFVQRGNYQLYCNQTPVHFHDTIQHGDQLEIVWE